MVHATIVERKETRKKQFVKPDSKSKAPTLFLDLKQDTEVRGAAICGTVEYLLWQWAARLLSQKTIKSSRIQIYGLLTLGQHLTWPHMIQASRSTKTTLVIMRSKEVEKTTIMGDLSNIMCDSQGNESLTVKIMNVAVTPKCEIDFLSITMLLKNGWKLEGSKSYISLKKNGLEIKFDIVVNRNCFGG